MASENGRQVGERDAVVALEVGLDLYSALVEGVFESLDFPSAFM